MAVTRTFSIIKPDATRRNLTGAVTKMLEDAGLRVVASKRIHMTREPQIDEVRAPGLCQLPGASNLHPGVVAAGGQRDGDAQPGFGQRSEGGDARRGGRFSGGHEQGGTHFQMRPLREHPRDQHRTQRMAHKNAVRVAQDHAAQLDLPDDGKRALGLGQIDHQRGRICGCPPLLPMRCGRTIKAGNDQGLGHGGLLSITI